MEPYTKVRVSTDPGGAAGGLFLPRLKGRHVIVRTDSTVTAAYINRQGGLGSPTLCKLATALASHVLVFDDSYPTRGSAMDASSKGGPLVSGRREIVPLLPSRAKAGSLAPERDRLLALGLPDAVARTMQEARAPSTRAAYTYRWQVFTG